MYLAAIVLLLLVIPAASVILEALFYPGAATLMALIGKWFTFWGVGVRLSLAGVMQVFNPRFTASIFDLKDGSAYGIVRDVGFGKLSMGALGLASLFYPDWVVPAAAVGGLYYGLTGLGHATRRGPNLKEQVALYSDLAMFVLLAGFVLSRTF
jgi:hypothetical protein